MTRRTSEAGFSLVALFAGVTIMMVFMAVAMPSWKWVAQNEREQELFFRGNAIATAIERYQKKNGNAAPPSLEVLVKGKYLRQEYKDPMTKDGKWNFIRPGQMTGPAQPGRPPGTGAAGGAAPGHTTVPGASAPGLPGASATVMAGNLGPFIGVSSKSDEKSFRLMNGAETYDQWMFVAGRPRVLGKAYLAAPGVAPAPGAAPGAQPGPGTPPGGPPTGPTKN